MGIPTVGVQVYDNPAFPYTYLTEAANKMDMEVSSLASPTYETAPFSVITQIPVPSASTQDEKKEKLEEEPPVVTTSIPAPSATAVTSSTSNPEGQATEPAARKVFDPLRTAMRPAARKAFDPLRTTMQPTAPNPADKPKGPPGGPGKRW